MKLSQKAPVAYIASPIDRVPTGPGHHDLVDWRDQCRVALDNHGFIFFDPVAAWYVSKSYRMSSAPLPVALARVDFAAVDSADALIAILPDQYPTLGVPMEIERALQRGIPVVAIGGSAAQRSPLLTDRVTVYNLNQIDLAVRQLKAKCDHLPERPALKVIGDGELPTRTYPDDCGMDLFTYVPPDHKESVPPYEAPSGSYMVNPGQFFDIDCGVSVELPPGVWGLITGRSSAIRKKNLLVVNGIIDTGYRGRLFMPVINMGPDVQFVRHRERIGQLILMQNVTLGYDIRRVDFLSPSDRGENGRGSSGA